MTLSILPTTPLHSRSFSLSSQVITNILTAQEFWSEHAGAAKEKSKEQQRRQEVGVSGAFLAEIKPQVREK